MTLNDFGRYVEQHRGDEPVELIAKKADIETKRLNRWMRVDPKKAPYLPSDVTQGVAKALGMPLIELQKLALWMGAAAEENTPTMNDQQARVVRAMQLVPECWQYAIMDQVMRQVSEITHHYDIEHDGV